MANGLAKIFINKPANEEISISLDYSESQRLCRRNRSWKSHFTNNFMNKTVIIFVNHRKQANYKLVLQLRYKRIITTPGDLFEQSDLTKIESLLANSVL